MILIDQLSKCCDANVDKERNTGILICTECLNILTPKEVYASDEPEDIDYHEEYERIQARKRNERFK